MANLKETTAPQITLANAATGEHHAIRKVEHDAALSEKADSAAVASAIAAATHPTATVGAGSQSLDLSVDAGQVIGGEVKPRGNATVQASGVGVEATFDHPVESGAELDLGKLRVANLVVIRQSAEGEELAEGEEGVDFTLDAFPG